MSNIILVLIPINFLPNCHNVCSYLHESFRLINSLKLHIYNSVCYWNIDSSLPKTLLAFITLSAAQSSAQTRIHSAILFIDTSNNHSYNKFIG